MISPLFKRLSANFLFICTICIAMDPNPENDLEYVYQKPNIQGNLDGFAGEKVIVLYRGVHFLANQFTAPARQQYIQTNRVNQPMYSSAAYELAGLGYDQVNHPLLEARSMEIAGKINDLNFEDECIVKGRHYQTPRYAFQQLYSNDYEGFFQQLRTPSGDYRPIFEQFNFTKNPLISFSDRVKHPGKYGFGLKNYGNNQALLPNYNLRGQPQHSIVGKLYGVILDEAAVEQYMPLNVMKAHNSNALRLYSHFRNDILSEREISIAGAIPEEYVVFEMPLQVPSFTGDYPAYYARKYGLSKTRYNNFKRIFTAPTTTAETRARKTRELMAGIIEAPRQDNNGLYNYTLSSSIPSIFSAELDRIGSQQSTLNLDYELE